MSRRGHVFDLIAATGARAAHLRTPDVTAIQAVWQDKTGMMWCTQPRVDTVRGGTETTLLSRLGSDGEHLDTMTLDQGGHGVSVAVEHDGSGDPTVYFCWQYSQRTDLVRFPYRPGTTISEDDPSIETVWPGPVGFFAINFGADRIVIRDRGSGGKAACHLRRWSDVLAGTDEELAHITVPSSHPRRQHTFQGLAVDADHLYELTGDRKPDRTEPTYIWQYAWTDGRVVNRRDISGFGLTDGTAPGNSNEPEGIAFSDHPASSALLVGLAQGRRATRRQLVYQFGTPTSG